MSCSSITISAGEDTTKQRPCITGKKKEKNDYVKRKYAKKNKKSCVKMRSKDPFGTLHGGYYNGVGCIRYIVRKNTERSTLKV